MRVTVCRILSALLSCLGDRCMMTTNAMPQSLGMCSKKVISAFSPPADAPIPTTGYSSVLLARLEFSGVDGSGLLLFGIGARCIPARRVDGILGRQLGGGEI